MKLLMFDKQTLHYVIENYHYMLIKNQTYTSKRCKNPGIKIIKKDIISKIIWKETKKHVNCKILNQLSLMFLWKWDGNKIVPPISTGHKYLLWKTNHPNYPYPLPIYFLTFILSKPEELIQEASIRYENSSIIGRKSAFLSFPQS